MNGDVPEPDVAVPESSDASQSEITREECSKSSRCGRVPYRTGWWSKSRWVLLVLLLGSLGVNWGQYRLWQAARGDGPREVHHSGDVGSEAKLALVPITGVIMPPLTGRVLAMIDKVQEDKSVQGMVLAIDLSLIHI